MSSEEVRRVSFEDIQLVQNLIERCLQLHMTQEEVMNTLLVKDKIEPVFTELVWQKLEEQNPDFFEAYHFQLLVKEQVVKSNQFLGKQAELMNQLSVGRPTGSHIPLLSQNSACYGQEYTGSNLQSGDMQRPLDSSLYSNGGSSLMHMQGTVDISTDARKHDTLSNMLMSHSSDMGLVQVQGMNRQMVKPETSYINDSPSMFGPNGNVLDACHAAGEMLELQSQPMNNNTFLGSDVADDSLGQIPRNFSLSDLTADISQGSDIWESYCRSPFLTTDSDSFVDSKLPVQPQGAQIQHAMVKSTLDLLFWPFFILTNDLKHGIGEKNELKDVEAGNLLHKLFPLHVWI